MGLSVSVAVRGWEVGMRNVAWDKTRVGLG